MSPVKPIIVGDQTKLQLTFGATAALVSTVAAHVLAASFLYISIDRRLGSLESTVFQHERRIDRVEAKVYPTSMLTAGATNP